MPQADYNTGFGDIFTNPVLEVWSMRHAFEAWHAGALDRMFHHLSAVCANMVAISLSDDRIGGRTVTSHLDTMYCFHFY